MIPDAHNFVTYYFGSKKKKGLNGIHGLFTTIEVGSLVQVTLATIEII